MHPSKRRLSSSGQTSPLESNLGILLVDFFDLYGRSLNMKDVGVSCRIGGSFFSKKNRG
jgi:non-canonical poly(A) RNA polymerase PAPD5/7